MIAAIPSSSPNGFLIAIIVGVVVIAMFKSRRSQSGRVGPGWWIGLVILLVGLSIAFGFTTWSSRGGYEERVATVPSIKMGLREARQEIQAATQEVKDSLQQAKEQLQEAFDFSSNKGEKGGSKGITIVHSPSAPPVPPPHRVTKYWVVEGDPDGSSDEQYVRKTVLQKAAQTIDEWVADQLPTKAYYVSNSRDPARLGLSAQKVDVVTKKVDLADGETETLFTGSYKIALTPERQEDLLSTAFSDLERGLASETLEIQGIFFIVIAGITVLAALLGVYRYYVCWSRRKLAALPTDPSH